MLPPPESADVRTVLQRQPDLILLQTDVRTLDCCGLLAQLKGNETTASVKIILLAEGGALERSHALDLGADDVLSIPFEPSELFARIRAQLREKAPDDRLRQEVLEARKKESRRPKRHWLLSLPRKRPGKRRWIALGVLAALVLVGVVIVIETHRSAESRTRPSPCSWKISARRSSPKANFWSVHSRAGTRAARS